MVLARAASAGTLLVAAAAAALVTSALLTAVALYAMLLSEAGARASIAQAPGPDRILLVTTSTIVDPDVPGGGGVPDLVDMAQRDAAVRELFASGLAEAPVTVSAGGFAVRQRLPDELPGVDPGEHGAYAMVGFLPELPDHAELVAGGWPEPVPAGAPAQVTLPIQVAETMALTVGDEVAIVTELAAPQPAPVQVVGLWEPTDPDASYWQLVDARVAGSNVWGPFVVHVDEFATRYQRGGSLAWVAVPDPAALAAAGPDRIQTGLADLAGGLTAGQADGTLGRSAQLRTGLGRLADQLAAATVVNRSGLIMPAALLAVIAGYGLVLVARLLAAHRRAENALLRARGAGRSQLVRFAAAEAALVVAPAALLGAPAGKWLVARADGLAGGRSLDIATDLAAAGLLGPPAAWVVALAAATGCALALALPAAGRGRSWVAEQQQRSRPSRATWLGRAGVDLALLAVAVLAWLQLRQYGAAVLPRDAGLGVDPLLVLAPVVGVLAATALALRLLPAATRLAVHWAGRRRSFAGLLGAWQADRRPHAGPVLLLVLAVATAVLAPVVAATWQLSQHHQAAHQVGADLRLAGEPAHAPAVSEAAGAAQLARTMPVHRDRLVVAGRSTTLLAVDSTQAPAVTRLRADLASEEPQQLFGRLHDGRPELAGVPLPEDATRLAGTIRLDAVGDLTQTVTVVGLDGEPVTTDVDLPDPGGGRLTVYLADADGMVAAIRLGTVPPGGVYELDLPLPASAVSLVGLGAGVTTHGWLFPFGVEPVERGGSDLDLIWRWDLHALDATGETTALAAPDSWVANTSASRPSLTVGPTGAAGTGDATAVVATTLDTSRDAGTSTQFVLAPRPQFDAIPAVVTPDVLAANGETDGGAPNGTDPGPPGSVIQAGDLRLQVVGEVAALPGAEPGGEGASGIMVDLGWLSAQQLWSQRPMPVVAEWWLATTDPAPVAAAARAHGIEVNELAAATSQLLDDPLGSGVLLTLWAAAVAAALFAVFGLVVDARATALARTRELAVLHTLGAGPPALARSLMVEQALLAGLGVTAGGLIGLGVAASMGPSLVLTPAGAAPMPPPLVVVPGWQLTGLALGMLGVAVGLGALVARQVRREVTATALRMGDN